jgi:hypothetical protein
MWPLHEHPDTILIPERAFVISGDKRTPTSDLIAVLYSAEELDFQDPRAPRFLFLDREGKVALGIGGYVKGTIAYDFCGVMDDNGSDTYNISVPMLPALRTKLHMDASHSTIFIKMVGHTTKFGYFTVYMQGEFTGGSSGYGMQLKQAYARLGYITSGLARSTFDDAASLPTVDYNGPSGKISGKNVLAQYAPRLSDKWCCAISIEAPTATYTCGDDAQTIPQRVPDCSAYIHYGWGTNSHVRLSGICRWLSYRNLSASHNTFVFGWGLHISGQAAFCRRWMGYYSVAYGMGIARYINDLSGNGLDLIPNGSALEAPGAMGITGGLQYNISALWFISGGYSLCRLYNQRQLGSTAYRYGQYMVANMFYYISTECMLGIEYNRGMRTDMSGMSGTANRIYASIQYNF